eukprot:4528161-Amphidinium_carterae.3
MRLTPNQPEHRLWVNSKEVQQPPDLDGKQQEEHITANPDTIQPPPGLDPPAHNYVHPTPKAMARPDNYKPPHRLTGKQAPPVVAQLETSWTRRRSHRRTTRTKKKNNEWRPF